MIELSAATAGKLCRPLFRDKDAALHQLADDLCPSQSYDLLFPSALFLLDRGFPETSERDEVTSDWPLVSSLSVEDTYKLVQIGTANRLDRGFAFSNSATGFEAVFCREVQLSTGLVDGEPRLLIAKGDEEIS